MQRILRQNNLDLVREIECLRHVLQGVKPHIPPELDVYYEWAARACDEFRQRVVQNLHDLNLEQIDLLPDILSSTQTLTRSFRLFNQRWVSPVVRSSPSDRLCLKLLRWLHATSPETRNIPMALSDEELSVWPVEPTIYFMPCSAQHGLLYLPLFFHEFGHLLYRCHDQEMNALTEDLQEAIAELLELGVQRNDVYAQREVQQRSIIVETWYQWTQEIYCDAVGFVIGGPAFLDAFSMYMRMLGRGEYHISQQDLANRPHPVTWLRIRILSDRVRRTGYGAEAERLEDGWGTIAEATETAEDYYGYYDDRFLSVIKRTIDDMLTETSPRSSTEHETAGTAEEASPSPVHLLNSAWRQFWRDPEDYRAWEVEAIRRFLQQDAPPA